MWVLNYFYFYYFNYIYFIFIIMNIQEFYNISKEQIHNKFILLQKGLLHFDFNKLFLN